MGGEGQWKGTSSQAGEERENVHGSTLESYARVKNTDADTPDQLHIPFFTAHSIPYWGLPHLARPYSITPIPTHPCNHAILNADWFSWRTHLMKKKEKEKKRVRLHYPRPHKWEELRSLGSKHAFR